ncbi:MAG TPA: site-specific integrase [bacterium]|nr:site-specific integrase [bacterium]
MSKPNVHGLPQHLRKDAGGYFLDYFVQDGGLRNRTRVRLGQIPLAQAKKILAQHMQAIVEEKFLEPVKAKASFFEAAESYLAYSKARKKSFTRDSQRVRLFKEFFGDRSLESLTPDLVEGFLVHRKKEGLLKRPDKPVADGTLNLDIAILKTLVHRAVLNRMIDRDPIAGVRKFKPFSRNRTLEPEEYQRLLQNCSEHLKPMVKLAYLTAMRCGEILGLRWDQIDFKNGVILLEAEDTKTQEKREVPLTEELVDLLRGIPRTLNHPCVFTWKGQSMGSIKTAFKRACRVAKIEDFRFHDLRHCAVTNLRKAGVSDSVIMSISGHKTHAVFSKYDRVDREDRLAAIQRAKELNDTNMTKAEKRKVEQATA